MNHHATYSGDRVDIIIPLNTFNKTRFVEDTKKKKLYFSQTTIPYTRCIGHAQSGLGTIYCSSTLNIYNLIILPWYSALNLVMIFDNL